MRLSYRGVRYDSEPLPVDMAETQRIGRYRGHAFRFSYPRHIPIPQPTLDLTYRGMMYRTSATGAIQTLQPVAATTNEVVSTRNKAAKPNRQNLLRDVARVHSQNIQNRLQQRLEVARAQGNDNLVAQLEREMQQVV
ncbi:MAG TPA: DUF4278 domain-containing protein [Elainellaceae cyanobacterium]